MQHLQQEPHPHHRKITRKSIWTPRTTVAIESKRTLRNRNPNRSLHPVRSSIYTSPTTWPQLIPVPWTTRHHHPYRLFHWIIRDPMVCSSHSMSAYTVHPFSCPDPLNIHTSGNVTAWFDPLSYFPDESYANETREHKKQRAISKASRQAELKRLRIAQEIQREQEEIEVQLKDLEARGVLIEKALRGEAQNIEKWVLGSGYILEYPLNEISSTAWMRQRTTTRSYLRNFWRFGATSQHSSMLINEAL